MATSEVVDRLSHLPDTVLAHVLSYLTTGEAARTSVLSSRWIDVHRAVPVVHLVDAKKGDRECGRRNLPVCFEHQVNSALLCRDLTAPIRVLRLDTLHPTFGLLDQWILIALDAGAEEVDVKLRYYHDPNRRLCPFGPYEGSSADFDGDHRYVATPRHLFRSSTLRRLRLTNWTLDLPPPPSSLASSLETLVLKRVMAADGEVLQRLVAGCPRLADLTLEECPTATEVTVASASFWRFAMACCHHATRVVLHTPRLRSLHYKGGLPPPSFFSIPSCDAVESVTIDICEGMEEKTPREVSPITTLVGRCINLSHFHLALRPEMAYYSSLFTGVLRGLPRLRRLELEGCLRNEHSVGAVAALLQSTHQLEALSLFPLPPYLPNKRPTFWCEYDVHNDDDGPQEDAGDGGGFDGTVGVFVPKRLWNTDTRCFKRNLRKINLVGYRGRPYERMLSKFLLSKAQAVEEFSVSVAPKLSAHKDEMTRELMSWRFSDRTRVACA